MTEEKKITLTPDEARAALSRLDGTTEIQQAAERSIRRQLADLEPKRIEHTGPKEIWIIRGPNGRDYHTSRQTFKDAMAMFSGYEHLVHAGPYLSPEAVLKLQSEAWEKGQLSVLNHQRETRRIAPRRQGAAFNGPPAPINPYAAKLKELDNDK